MSSRKDADLKQFLIAVRRKVSPGLTNAPVWVMQKAGKRIWSSYGKRHWRDTGFGSQFRSLKLKEKRQTLKRSE